MTSSAKTSCNAGCTVVALAGPLVKVKVPRPPRCANCACSRREILNDDTAKIIFARNPLRAHPGDVVQLVENTGTPTKNTILVLTFISMCIAGLFTGAIILAWIAPLGHHDLDTGLGGIVGLICALLATKYLFASRYSSFANGLPAALPLT